MKPSLVNESAAAPLSSSSGAGTDFGTGWLKHRDINWGLPSIWGFSLHFFVSHQRDWRLKA